MLQFRDVEEENRVRDVAAYGTLPLRPNSAALPQIYIFGWQLSHWKTNGDRANLTVAGLQEETPRQRCTKEDPDKGAGWSEEREEEVKQLDIACVYWWCI